MTSIFNIIGVFSAGLGLIGFVKSNMPKPLDVKPTDSTVRIAVGLNGDKGVPGALRHAGGDVPLILAYNENQNLCGFSSAYDHTVISSGSFQDIIIRQDEYGPGEQATYLQIIPTTNELCIAYISQTWADGGQRGWVGDMGKGCYRNWYYSNIIVGTGHKPTCTWIDNNHSHHIRTAALQIHMQDFINLTGNYTEDSSFYCSHPTMHFKGNVPKKTQQDARGHYYMVLRDGYKFWDNSDTSLSVLDRGTNGEGPDDKGKKAKRGLTRRSGLSAFSHLIASPHDTHSARELCESEHSHGPDFVSFSEGLFCDMDAKMHWPLCNESTTVEVGRELGGCYHWDTHSLVLEAGDAMARNYSHVVEWE